MASQKLTLPRVNTNDDTVEIAHWYVKDGDRVEVGADILDVETSKAAVTIQATAAGFVKRLREAREQVRVGDALAAVYATAEELKNDRAAPEPVAAAPPVETSGPASTGARGGFESARLSRAAKEHLAKTGGDPAKIAAGGRGLVTLASLTGTRGASAGAETPARRTVTPSSGLGSEPPLPPFASQLRSERVGRAKRLEIEALAAGQAGNINSSLTVELKTAAIRKALRESPLNGQMLPLILCELARLLEQSRELTSFFHGDRVYYYDRVDVGVAIDIGKGLKVPVLRNAAKLLPLEIYEKLTELTLRYMENKLTEEELTGGTVTVTDLSGQDIYSHQPLLNQHQAVILGIGGDSKVDRHPMTLTVVYDHRVLTGRDVALFTKELKSRILSHEPREAPSGGALSRWFGKTR